MVKSVLSKHERSALNRATNPTLICPSARLASAVVFCRNVDYVVLVVWRHPSGWTRVAAPGAGREDHIHRPTTTTTRHGRRERSIPGDDEMWPTGLRVHSLSGICCQPSWLPHKCVQGNYSLEWDQSLVFSVTVPVISCVGFSFGIWIWRIVCIFVLCYEWYIKVTHKACNSLSCVPFFRFSKEMFSVKNCGSSIQCSLDRKQLEIWIKLCEINAWKAFKLWFPFLLVLWGWTCCSLVHNKPI